MKVPPLERHSFPALFVSAGSSATRTKRQCAASSADRASTTEAKLPEPDIATMALDGISFTPAGLLYPYYVGVGAALQDMELITEGTRQAAKHHGHLSIAMVVTMVV